MNREFKERIITYIQKHDPKGELIAEIRPNGDYSGGKIVYNKDNLILHRNISELKDEEYARAYLVVKLAKELKYPPSCIELEKEYQAGRPKTIKPRIDILVKDKRKKKERTYLFIEVKTPEKYENDKDYIEGQLFKLAAIEDKESQVQYLVYLTIQEKAGSIEDQAIIIDYGYYSSFYSWTDAGKISLDRLPVEYGVARKLVYVNKKNEDLRPGEKNLDRKVTRDRFNFLRKDLHNVLWGGGGMNYNDIFSNLVKLFLAKIYDEETTREGKSYTFQIEFKDAKPEPPEEVYKKINKLFKQAQKEYLSYSDTVIRNSVGIDKEKISENKVSYVVEQLQGISLLENENKDNGDLLGEFFEGIVSEGFKQDKGQFFTHPNIVRFILHGLNLEQLAVYLVNGKENPVKPRLPFICDPACGSGTFLIESMKFITKTIKSREKVERSRKIDEFLAANFLPFRENIWAREFIYGMEINPDLALATKVNMVLHGDGNINIFPKDGLLPFSHYEILNKISALKTSETKTNYSYPYEVNESFDVVMSNPPFSVSLDTETRRTLPNRFIYHDKRNSENLFIERWYQILKEGGRMGIVLPESVFDTTENMYIRLFLYKYFIIKAIVSLPQLSFQPFTSTKTSLLFAQKKTRQEVEAYEEKWREFSNEYQRTKRRVGRYKKGEIDNETEAKTILKRYLKHYLEEIDHTLSPQEIIIKYQDEIAEIDINHDWWIFGEVSKHFDYKFFMAEAKEIGYKRSKRGEHKRPNDLFQEDEYGDIIIDTLKPKTILDSLKVKVRWS
jgi:type I restriction enzyme M protein